MLLKGSNIDVEGAEKYIDYVFMVALGVAIPYLISSLETPTPTPAPAPGFFHIRKI